MISVWQRIFLFLYLWLRSVAARIRTPNLPHDTDVLTAAVAKLAIVCVIFASLSSIDFMSIVYLLIFKKPVTLMKRIPYSTSKHWISSIYTALEIKRIWAHRFEKNTASIYSQTSELQQCQKIRKAEYAQSISVL